MRSFWSKEEDDVLRELYGKVLDAEIAKVLTSRTPNAISLRAKKLNICKNNFGGINHDYLSTLRKEIEG